MQENENYSLVLQIRTKIAEDKSKQCEQMGNMKTAFHLSLN